MKTPYKLKSRKFWLAQQIIVLTVGVPLLFAHFGIDASVTLVALGSITSIGAFYGISNIMAKKYGGDT